MSDHAVIAVQENGFIDDDVSRWSPHQVAAWMRKNGFKEFERGATDGLWAMDGKRLLTLTRDDLRSPPFDVTESHEADHLLTCVEGLRRIQLAKYMKQLEQNGIRSNGFRHDEKKHSHHLANGAGLGNGYAHSDDVMENGDHLYTSINSPLLPGGDVEHGCPSSNHATSAQQFPPEKMKTLFGLMYMMFGFVVSVLMLQVVHDRVPDMTEEPPLRDVFFDVVPSRVEGAFSVCETLGMVLTSCVACLAVFHKHRFIIARRLFFIVGTLYLYRSCTTYVTTLPVPGLHFKCAPKSHGSIAVKLSRATGLLLGGGLTATGSHNLCGDYLFSGHTIILVIAYLTLHEYTPRRWWWLHWTAWILAATGIVCILLAHDHYTIDVVVAYLLTTRLFWTYHSMCNMAALKEASSANMLSRAWWFPIFRYLEGNVCASSVPRQFECPLPLPVRFLPGVKPARRGPIKGV